MVVSATMISTLRRTSSSANADNRANLSSAYLYSIMIFFPSMYPKSCKPWRKASSLRGARCAGIGRMEIA